MAVNIKERVSQLHVICHEKYPEAANLREIDVFAALDAVPELTVRHLESRPNLPGCPVDGRYHIVDGQPIIDIYSRADARDRFTAMHEFGHFLLAQDEDWQYDIRLKLGIDGRRVEESIVNGFAAESLIPDDLLHAHLKDSVTAVGVRSLYLNSQASASASLVRALSLPGDRCVMLTDLDGVPYFTDSSGEPFSPPSNIVQPSVARAILDAVSNSERTATLSGGVGIVYGSGKTNPHVLFDVALGEGLAFVIATPTAPDSRLTSECETMLHICEDCAQEFEPRNNAGICLRCREPKSPCCTACSCTEPRPLCAECYLELPRFDVQAGRDRHEEC